MRTAAYVRERLEIVQGLDFEDPASAEDITAILDAFATWDEADCKAQASSGSTRCAVALARAIDLC
jgi:hypothetical protein